MPPKYTSLNFKIRVSCLFNSILMSGIDCPKVQWKYPNVILRTLCLGSLVRTHQYSSKPGTAGALVGLLPPYRVPLSRPGLKVGRPVWVWNRAQQGVWGREEKSWRFEETMLMHKGSVGCSIHNGEHNSALWTWFKFFCVDKVWLTHIKLNGCRGNCL